MTHELIIKPRLVPHREAASLPSLIVSAGGNTAEKFIEFFRGQIRNRNTREAYARRRAIHDLV